MVFINGFIIFVIITGREIFSQDAVPRPCRSAPPSPVRAENKCNVTSCTITCNLGYAFPNGDTQISLSCQNDEWKSEGKSLENGLACQPVCQPPCENNGTCELPNQCSCPVGYSGNYCELKNQACTSLPKEPLNAERLCSNTKCMIFCKEGYQFPDGSQKITLHCIDDKWLEDEPKWPTVPDCEAVCTNPCQNNGTCVAPNRCKCSEEFRGPQCQYHVSNCVLPHFNGNRHCTDDGLSISCTLSCPPETEFKEAPASKYVCQYSEGTFEPIPQCQPRKESCYAVGDPHYKTFDGKFYDFMGRCSYYLLKMKTYSIEAENVACIGNTFQNQDLPNLPSCTKSVSVNIYGQTIKLDLNQVVMVNGEVETLPYRLQDVTVRRVSSEFLQVDLPNDVQVMWNSMTQVYIYVSSTFKEETAGLCGVFNYNQTDDFTNPDGTIEPNVTNFANKWKTEEKCQNVEPVPHPCDVDNKPKAEEHCQVIKSNVFKSCHWKVNPEPYFQNCLYDLCACGTNHSKCLCPILATYAQECARNGIKIERTVKECEVECPPGQEYQICSNSCQRTCFDPVEKNCQAVCVAGCNCPNGKVLNAEDQCVPIDQCPKTAECSVWGDSHYKTFDGKHFDFQGECDYVLASATAENYWFQVSTQNIPCGSLGTTCSKSVTIRVRSGQKQDELTLIRDNPLPHGQNFNFIKMKQIGLFVIVEVPTLGVMVRWDQGTRVYIRVDSVLKSKVQGLCGNYNDEEDDDFREPSTEFVTSAMLFGNSWKLNESCPNAIAVTNPCKERPHRKSWAFRKCTILKSEVFSSCHAQVPVDIYMEKCIFDACACDQGGDCECLCTAIGAYVQECNNKGISIQWRSQKLCPMQCDHPSYEYKPCTSICSFETCDNFGRKRCHEKMCVEGCVPKPCPANQVYVNTSYSECVSKGQCVTEDTTLAPSFTLAPSSATEPLIPFLSSFTTLLPSLTSFFSNTTLAPDSTTLSSIVTSLPPNATLPTDSTTLPPSTTTLLLNTTLSPDSTTLLPNSSTLAANATLPTDFTTLPPSSTLSSDSTTLSPILTTLQPDSTTWLLNTTFSPNFTTLPLDSTTFSPNTTLPSNTTTYLQPDSTTLSPNLSTLPPSTTLSPHLAPNSSTLPANAILPTDSATLPQSTTFSPDSTTFSPNLTTLQPDSTTLPSILITLLPNTTLAPDSTTLSPTLTTLPLESTTLSPNTTLPSGHITLTPNFTTLPRDSTTSTPSITTLSPNTTLPSDSITLPSDSTTLAPSSTTVTETATEEPVSTCKPPPEISCNYGEVKTLAKDSQNCDTYICECKPRDQCEPVDLLEMPLDNGFVQTIDKSGCCPKPTIICQLENCPEPPPCPQYYVLKYTPGKCCPFYTCERPKDMCIYENQYTAAAEGGERMRTDGEKESNLQKSGTSWKDGPCRECNCSSTNTGEVQVTCAKNVCPWNDPEMDDYVLDEVAQPNQCCPAVERVACKHDGKVYPVGETWNSEENPCETYKCSNKTKVVKETQVTKCNTNCNFGFEYKNESGKCCGVCKPIACVFKGQLYQPEEKWQSDDHCTNYQCVEINGTMQLRYQRLQCLKPTPEFFDNYFYETVSIPGKCCDEYKTTACKVDGKEYQVGSTWPSLDKCKKMACAKSGNKIIKQEVAETCNTNCSMGWEYRKSDDGSCCGKCVKVACVFDDELKQLGEEWFSENNCTKYSCEEFGIVKFEESCPVVKQCPEENLYVKGCCQHCKTPIENLELCGVEAVPLNETVRMVKVLDEEHGECVNKQPINVLTKCVGACPSSVSYNTIRGNYVTECSCCQLLESTSVKIDLECDDGEKIVTQVEVPSKCGCGESCTNLKKFTK